MEARIAARSIVNIRLLLTLIIMFGLAACSETLPPPALSGPWKAGAATFEIHDGEHWAQIRAWYPTAQESAQKMLASDEFSIRAFARSVGMPRFLMGEPDISRSNLGVAVATGRFPVLIFNHGLMSYERQNTTQFEQLASHGYVVLSVANPGVSMVVVRDNGEVIDVDERGAAFQALQKQKDGAKAYAPALLADVKRAQESGDFAHYREAMATLADNPVFKPMQPVFAAAYANNRLLLASLPSIQQGKIATPLAGHLDLENLGAFGHSLGSILSGQLAGGGFGIKAAFGMDAPQLNLGVAEYRPFGVPVCYTYADELKYAGENIAMHYINRPLLKRAGSCEAVFAHSAHYNFTDLNLVKALRFTPMLGKVDNALMADNLEKLLLAFFDEHLKGKTSLATLHLDQVELRVY